MSGQHDIALRMEKISEIFQNTMSVPADQLDRISLIAYLEKIENEFQSIAYEGIAMALALKDLSNSDRVDHWRSFMEGPGAKHSVQVHAGLGWAIAQKRISILPFMKQVEPVMGFRLLDGYGYYDGIFRKRKTIGSQEIPGDLSDKFLQGYDQGVGRSLWYIYKGDPQKSSEIISMFSSSRQKDLWRGIGIAAVYVGGCDENILRELLSFASNHQVQLSVGAALVSRSRSEAGLLTEYVESACRIWCNRSVHEVISATETTQPPITIDPDEAYLRWLSNLEEELMPLKER